MNIPECFSCAGESMMFGELASAEGLVIHVPFLYQSVSAFLKTATTPVLIPPQDFITSGQKGLRTYLRIQIGNGFIITSTVDNIAGPTPAVSTCSRSFQREEARVVVRRV